MSFELQVFGATGEVTGSLDAIRTDGHTVLLEHGLFQGGAENKERNRLSSTVAVDEIDAAILSHLHIPNFHETRTPEESMAINEIRSGAIVIAGSGMCSGGRKAQKVLAEKMRKEFGAPISIAEHKQKIQIESHGGRS